MLFGVTDPALKRRGINGKMRMELPDKRYNIIYADPPWDIGGYLKETKKGLSDYNLPYFTMSDLDIINLPIKNIVAEDLILFIWCCDSKIPILESITNSWGFEFRCIGFIWNKRAKTTNGTNASYSIFTRRSCEYCFIGVRGKYLIKRHDINQLVSIPKRDHSSKPGAFRTMIVQLCGDIPRIELFSRDNVEGWDAWGNQVPKHCQKLLVIEDA